jgi:hypothetical protein
MESGLYCKGRHSISPFPFAASPLPSPSPMPAPSPSVPTSPGAAPLAACRLLHFVEFLLAKASVAEAQVTHDSLVYDCEEYVAPAVFQAAVYMSSCVWRCVGSRFQQCRELREGGGRCGSRVDNCDVVVWGWR